MKKLYIAALVAAATMFLLVLGGCQAIGETLGYQPDGEIKGINLDFGSSTMGVTYIPRDSYVTFMDVWYFTTPGEESTRRRLQATWQSTDTVGTDQGKEIWRLTEWGGYALDPQTTYFAQIELKYWKWDYDYYNETGNSRKIWKTKTWVYKLAPGQPPQVVQ